MKKLPIGIQTFREIIKDGYIYIDKTKEAYELITDYKYVFLSRPRRFGKSLFLDTLKEIFEGNSELFRGLFIYEKYDFKQFPVIKIDLSGDFSSLENTMETTRHILRKNAERLGVKCDATNPSIMLDQLINEAFKKYKNRVVVLVDEYDKPILDNIDNLDIAKKNRDFLRGVYSQLKSNDEFLRFVFLTGITKFSKASIFSGLNNLEDISLNPNFGNVCGYTQDNLKNEFNEYTKDLDLDKIGEWYNGYYFLKDEIYNPYDVLKILKYKRFGNYWFESGNPYFLIEMLKRNKYFIPQLENLTVREELLNSFDVENLKLEVLLYQTGYLTIDNVSVGLDGTYRYTLKIPNREVQISLNRLIIDYLTQKTDDVKREELLNALFDSNFEGLKSTLSSIFASIPYTNYVKNTIGDYEGYYASVIYAYLASLGVKVIAEDTTNTGRIDMTLFVGNKVYILEFKVDDSGALDQIKKRKYFEKYLSLKREIYLVGIEFDSNVKNIKDLKWEKVEV